MSLKFYIRVFFEILSRRMMFRWDMERVAVSLQEDICTFTIIISSYSSYNKKYIRQCCRESQIPYFMYSNLFSRKSWRISLKFDIRIFFENLSRKLKFHWDTKRVTGTLQEDICTFTIIISSFSSYNKKYFRQCCRENQNPHFMCTINFYPRKSWRLWDDLEKYGTAGQTTDDKMAHALCMPDN